VTVRGDVRTFCVDGPTVTTVVLNGAKVEFRREGKYGVAKSSTTTGKGGAPAVASAPGKPEAPVVSVEIAMPQRNVNIHADKGGWMVVRVINRVAAPARGVVSVKAGPGLIVSAARQFTNLPPAHRVDFGFELKPEGAQDGGIIPVDITVSASAGEAINSYSITTHVAVGIIVDKVPFTFRIPVYDLQERLPSKPKRMDKWLVRTFDYIQVHAPGYTVKVDKFSGGVLSIMDSTGLLRSSLCAYPFGSVVR